MRRSTLSKTIVLILVVVLAIALSSLTLKQVHGSTNTAQLGEELPAGDWDNPFSITFTKVWTSLGLNQAPYGYREPSGGYRFVVVDFIVKNTAKRAISGSWICKPTLYDSEGYSYDVIDKRIDLDLRVEESKSAYFVYQMLDRTRPNKIVLCGGTEITFQSVLLKSVDSGTVSFGSQGRTLSVTRFTVSNVPTLATINSIKLILPTGPRQGSSSFSVFQIPNELWNGSKLTRNQSYAINSNANQQALDQISLQSGGSYLSLDVTQAQFRIAKRVNITLGLDAYVANGDPGLVSYSAKNAELDITYTPFVNTEPTTTSTHSSQSASTVNLANLMLVVLTVVAVVALIPIWVWLKGRASAQDDKITIEDE